MTTAAAPLTPRHCQQPYAPSRTFLSLKPNYPTFVASPHQNVLVDPHSFLRCRPCSSGFCQALREFPVFSVYATWMGLIFFVLFCGSDQLTSPVASTTCQANQPCNVSWNDDNTTPSLSDIGTFGILNEPSSFTFIKTPSVILRKQRPVRRWTFRRQPDHSDSASGPGQCECRQRGVFKSRMLNVLPCRTG